MNIYRDLRLFVVGLVILGGGLLFALSPVLILVSAVVIGVSVVFIFDSDPVLDPQPRLVHAFPPVPGMIIALEHEVLAEMHPGGMAWHGEGCPTCFPAPVRRRVWGGRPLSPADFEPCSCGYTTECGMHCGNGHETGDCPSPAEAWERKRVMTQKMAEVAYSNLRLSHRLTGSTGPR